MNEIVEQKKAELNEKAKRYKEEFIADYNHMIKNPGSFVRLGMQSGGLLINSLFPDKKDTHDDSSGTGTIHKKNQLEDIEKRGMEWQFKAEYKEKLVLVLLEILRQILLLLTEKLAPAHDDPDLR